MTEHLTEDDVLAAIPTLTRGRLVAFIETEVIVPLRHDTGTGTSHAFRRIDIARLHLLCELADALDLDEAALGVIIALIDQLHAARSEFLTLARAVGAEAPEIRARIGAALDQSRE